MKIGIALSGGSIRGMAHIGILRALMEAGIKPDLISGASAGGIIAGLAGAGLTLDEMEANALKTGRQLVDFDYRGVFVRWMKKEHAVDGFLKGNRLEEWFSELTGNKKMPESHLPMAIPAVDVNTAQTTMFVSDKTGLVDDAYIQYFSDIEIGKAIRATVSLPAVFRPVEIEINGEKRLIDGGIKDNLPFEILMQMGADKIIAINLGYSGQIENDIDNIFEITTHVTSIMNYTILQYKKELYNIAEIKNNFTWEHQAINRDVVIINPEIYDVAMFEYQRIPEVIERGYEKIKKQIPLIKKILRLS